MADLVTRSRLDDSDFNRGLARMRKEARDFNKKLGGEFARVFSGAAVGAGITAALYGAGRAITSIVRDADELGDMAGTLDVLPSSLLKVGAAAQLMGGSMEAVVRSAIKLRVNLGKVADGDRETSETLRLMGLEAKTLAGMELPEMVIALSQGLRTAEKSGRGYLAMQMLLGKGAADLINLLRNEPDYLIDLFSKIRPATNEAVKALGDLSDEWDLFIQNQKTKATNFLGGVVVGYRMLRAAMQGVPPEVEAIRVMAGNAPKSSGVDPDETSRLGAERDARAKALEAAEKTKQARAEAARSDEQNLAHLQQSLKDLRSGWSRMNLESAEFAKSLEQEQKLLLEIENLQRKITAERARQREEAEKEAEARRKDAEKAAEEARRNAEKERGLALEIAIEKLKSDGKEHAVEEARIRLAAAEAELKLAEGKLETDERGLQVLVARNLLSAAIDAQAGKPKNERIAEYIGQGMSSGQARKKVRQEDREAKRVGARMSAFERGATQETSIMDEGVRKYMGSGTAAGGKMGEFQGKGSVAGSSGGGTDASIGTLSEKLDSIIQILGKATDPGN